MFESNEHDGWQGQAQGPRTATIDEEVLANLRGLPGDEDGDLLRELIDLFLQDAPTRLSQIHRALLDGDGCAVAQIAHSLKGSSVNLGARDMASICGQIEQQGRAGNLQNGTALHAALEEEFARVFRALDLERQRCARAA